MVLATVGSPAFALIHQIPPAIGLLIAKPITYLAFWLPLMLAICGNVVGESTCGTRQTI